MSRYLLMVGVLAAGCIEPAPPGGSVEPRRAVASSPAPRPAPPPAVPAASPASTPVSSSVSNAVSTAVSNTVPAARGSATPAAVPGLPAGAQAAGAIFGGAILVMGSKVEPATASPGQEVKVTMWLRVLAPPPSDDMVFVHVDDSEGRPERVNGDHWPANHKTPMPQWKVGDVVVDQFSFTLNGFSESSAATVWMGFWAPDRDERLPITNAAAVKTDGNNRFALIDIPLLH